MNYEFYYILGTLYYHLSNVISQNEKVKIKGESQMERKERIMARGKAFNHKKKGHPGPLPKNNRTEDKSKEAIGDEELIVTQEAFKNRVQTKDFG
jgi:hypothetical protein